MVKIDHKKTIVALAITAFVIARVLLWLVNPNDPEGTNLLVTTVVAAVVFGFLLLVYRAVRKGR